MAQRCLYAAWRGPRPAMSAAPAEIALPNRNRVGPGPPCARPLDRSTARPGPDPPHAPGSLGIGRRIAANIEATVGQDPPYARTLGRLGPARSIGTAVFDRVRGTRATCRNR